MIFINCFFLVALVLSEKLYAPKQKPCHCIMFYEKNQGFTNISLKKVKKLTITGKKCHTICTSVPFLNESKKEGLREATLQAFFWRKNISVWRKPLILRKFMFEAKLCVFCKKLQAFNFGENIFCKNKF